jgi:DNA-directed RNA polymerase specialized sigma24 family protein
MLADAAPDPFEDLFATEYPRVVAIARRFVGSDAEDVAQDVFAMLARTRPGDAAHARAWLHRAAVHRALDSLRSRRRRDARERRNAALEGPAWIARDPAASLEGEERSQAV